MKRHLILLLAIGLSMVACAGTVLPAIAWRDGKPVLQIELRGPLDLPADATEARVPAAVHLASDEAVVWQGAIAVALAGDGPWRGEQVLDMLKEPAKAHRAEIVLDGQYGIDHRESLTFAGETAAVRAFGLRRTGVFPDEQVSLVVHLNGFDKELSEVVCRYTLRDRTDTSIASREVPLMPGKLPTTHLVPVTPDRSASIGPYSLEFSLENDLLAVYTAATIKFGLANALVPVTGFERADRSLWFVVPQPEDARQRRTPFSFRTMAYYYSPHLNDRVPGDYPALDFAGEPHSGQQALRIGYQDGIEAHVWSRVELPGNPTHLLLWVKGTGGDDQLVVHFQDHINHTLQAWIRNAHFSRETVCSLDFEGWRRFRVPVLGLGQAIPSKKGSTEAIDGPISLLSFSVMPASRRKPTEERREVILDDLFVETQAAPGERLMLELQASDADGRLTANGTLRIALGNGSGQAGNPVVLSIVARDANGDSVATERRELAVADGAIALTELALAELAAKRPIGPLTIEVTATAGPFRARQRLAFKSPHQAAIVHDFEETAHFNGYDGAKVVPGEGLSHVDTDLGRSLAIAIGGETLVNSVLLHPVLPGIVDRVELKVKVEGAPATLEGWLVDDGFTGIWQRPNNLFRSPPQAIAAGGEWQTIVFQAPPVPAWYGDRERYFFDQPWYPLNLVLRVSAESEARVLVDDIRVVTHLPAVATVQAAVLYPDETRLHAPGSPLALRLTNYRETPATLDLAWTLTSYQGFVADRNNRSIVVGPGACERPVLIEALAPGIYELRVEGLSDRPLVAVITVLDPKAWFGDEPEALLTRLPDLRRTVRLLTEKVYLDWDNTEPVPNFFHFNWFNVAVGKAEATGADDIQPVFGFSSDWAGPEARPQIEDASYQRSFPNYLQIPVSTLDWSRFVRECLREFGPRFANYVFWENPDLDDAPQGIPPARYPELLREVHRWVKLYRPGATVIAGGFNFHKVLGYLEKIPEPETLAFDEIAVQMNLGELSPEAAEMEGFLDDLGALLKLKETGRAIRASELDWSIGEFVSPLQQAAYHTRASLILASRGVKPHQFAMLNSGFAFDGFGVVYRESYGSSEILQTFKPYHIPKPSYFALRQVQAFLDGHQFVAAVDLPHRKLGTCRAFVYHATDGRLAVVSWSAGDENRDYRQPATWQGTTGVDVFGVPLAEAGALRCRPLPCTYTLPAGYAFDQLIHDLRHLDAVDGDWSVVLDLHLEDESARQRAAYEATGTTAWTVYSGRVPGGGKIRARHLTGIVSERFQFTQGAAGDLLLTRRYTFDGTGERLTVQLDDGPAQAWDLTAGQDETPGPRAATFLLRGVTPGTHRLTVTYDRPGNCAGYRLEPIDDAAVPLDRWGILHTRQTVGEVARYESAVGTPLRIGRQEYADGLGTHATSMLEYPLNGQFARFTATVGIDGYTEGRGSVIFRVYIDGQEKASSGLMNGLSKPFLIELDDLKGAQRLILTVTDGGDGDKSDLANWVDAKLFTE